MIIINLYYFVARLIHLGLSKLVPHATNIILLFYCWLASTLSVHQISFTRCHLLARRSSFLWGNQTRKISSGIIWSSWVGHTRLESGWTPVITIRTMPGISAVKLVTLIYFFICYYLLFLFLIYDHWYWQTTVWCPTARISTKFQAIFVCQRFNIKHFVALKSNPNIILFHFWQLVHFNARQGISDCKDLQNTQCSIMQNTILSI